MEYPLEFAEIVELDPDNKDDARDHAEGMQQFYGWPYGDYLLMPNADPQDIDIMIRGARIFGAAYLNEPSPKHWLHKHWLAGRAHRQQYDNEVSQ